MASVIVDDRDTGITYSPASAWKQTQGVSQEFQSTTSLPTTTGAELVYTFQGTSIQVFGTIGYGQGASLAFVIDSSTPRTLDSADNLINLRSPVYHDLMFDSGSLSDGNHTLTITALKASLLSNLYIDYLTYSPSINLPLTGDSFFVDDSSQYLNYTGNVVATNPNAAGSYLNFGKTAHGLNNGATAALTFAGTGIQVYGTVPSNIAQGPVATFQIDTATPKIVDQPPLSDLLGGALTLNVVANYLWFDSGDLPAGTHTLQINSVSDQELYIDYMLIPSSGNSISAAFPPPALPSTSTTSSVSSATSSSSSSSSASTQSSSTQSSSSSSSSSLASASPVTGAAGSGASSSNSGAIAGGVVGGLAAISILAALVFLLMVRRKRRKDRSDALDPYGFSAPKPSYKPWTEKPTDPGFVTLAPQYPHLNNQAPIDEIPHQPYQTEPYLPDPYPPVSGGYQENVVTGYHNPSHALVPSPPPVAPMAHAAPASSQPREPLPGPLANITSPSSVPMQMNSAIYGTAGVNRQSNATHATNGPVYDLESIKTRQSTDMYGEAYAYAGDSFVHDEGPSHR